MQAHAHTHTCTHTRAHAHMHAHTHTHAHRTSLMVASAAAGEPVSEQVGTSEAASGPGFQSDGFKQCARATQERVGVSVWWHSFRLAVTGKVHWLAWAF